MQVLVPVSQSAVEQVGTYLQEKMGTLETPAHLLLFANAVVDVPHALITETAQGGIAAA